MLKPVYGRVLLKLSGEILAGNRGFGVDPKIAKSLAGEVKSAKDLDVDIAVVIVVCAVVDITSNHDCSIDHAHCAIGDI